MLRPPCIQRRPNSPCRPNLARTAAQLQQAGPDLIWVVIEDTHSLRTMAASEAHYQWVLDDTERYLTTLGVRFKYIRDPSPFPKGSPRSTKVESHQRNSGLIFSYSLIEDKDVGAAYGVHDCAFGGPAGDALRKRWRQGHVARGAELESLLQCPVIYIADDDNVYMPTLWPALRQVAQVALFPTGNMVRRHGSPSHRLH